MKAINPLLKLHIQLEHAMGLNVAMIGATVIKFSDYGVPGLLKKIGIPGGIIGILLIICGCFIMTRPEREQFLVLSIPILFYIVMSFLLFVSGAFHWLDVEAPMNPTYLYFYGGYYFLMMTSYMVYIRGKA